MMGFPDESMADRDGDEYWAQRGLGATETPETDEVGTIPAFPADDRYEGLFDEIAEADITLRCTECGNESRLSRLNSRFGAPQYLNHMGSRAVYEVTCPDKSCPTRRRKKGLEATYLEVK